VVPGEPLGWNPTKKVLPKATNKRKSNSFLFYRYHSVDPSNALLKHKRFLKNLEEKKSKEKEDKFIVDTQKEIKTKNFKDQAERQRKKIRDL